MFFSLNKIRASIADQYFYGALAVFCSVVIDMAILPYYFPPTEGWWETFAWLLTQNQEMYKDFYVSHPPLHILFMKMQMKFVGLDFMALRHIGVVTNATCVALIFIWLFRLTNAPAAFLGSIIPSLLTIYPMSAYIVRDYHTTVLLLESACLLLSVAVFKRRNIHAKLSKRSESIFPIFLIGIFCGALVLTKQNVAVFFTLGFAISLLYFHLNKINNVPILNIALNAAVWLFGLSALPLLCTYAYGSGWTSSYIGNEGKGSPFFVLFRFVIDSGMRKMLYAVIVGCFIFQYLELVCQFMLTTLAKFDLPVKTIRIEINKNWIIVLKIIAFMIYLQQLQFSIESAFYISSMTWLICSGLKKGDAQASKLYYWLKYASLPLIGLAYSGTNTAGYNLVSMQLIMALSIAFCCHGLMQRVPFLASRKTISCIGLSLLITMTALKLHGPLYSWWGLRQEGINAPRHSLSFEQLKGFRVDQRTSDFFELLYREKKALKTDETIFAYPSIPIVYLLLNKLPIVRFPILWFDVTSSAHASEVIANLTEQAPDKIYWLRPPIGVYTGHEALRRQPATMTAVDDWLMTAIANDQYSVESIQLFPTFVNYWDQSKTAEDYKIAELSVTVPNLTISKLKLLDGYISHSVIKTNRSNDEKLEKNSIVAVKFKNQLALEATLSQIGQPINERNSYVFLVLKKSDYTKSQ
jgi:hypothetical protein